MFLEPSELVRLTGYRRPSAQARWLRAHRIRHFVNAAGLPIVERAWLFGGTAEVVPMPARPDLRAIPGKA